MGKRDQTQSKPKFNELTFAEIAEAVESIFGCGSVGLAAGSSINATDEARSTFVRAALYLVVIQRLEGRCDSPDAVWGVKREATRKVREELASQLCVDVNEVFRLHHHAAGLRAKDHEYRIKAHGIEWGLAKKYGLGV